MPLFKKKRGTYETIKNSAKLITVAKPKSPIAEQFRTVRTNINFMAVDHDIKSLAFTSANISEGKSTVAANVAVTYAQAGRKILLVDADLRRPTVHSTFNLSNHVGLSTVISSTAKEVDLDSVVQESGVDNLYVLTAGPMPPNPAELIGSKRMRDFVKLTEERYDLVIRREDAGKPAFQTMLSILRSPAFRNELAGMGGYGLSQLGQIIAEI